MDRTPKNQIIKIDAAKSKFNKMISILIVDDQKTSQEFLKMSLEVEPDFRVVGLANNGKEGIEQVIKHQPDIVIMDVNMPVMDGFAATRVISERYTSTKVLMFSLYDDDESLSNAIESGAKGYLLKNTPSEEIVLAIRSVSQGYFQLGPGLLERYLYRFSISSSSYQELKEKLSETSNDSDTNVHLNFVVDKLMRNISILERRTTQNRNLVYMALICNCFILLFIVFYQLW